MLRDGTFRMKGHRFHVRKVMAWISAETYAVNLPTRQIQKHVGEGGYRTMGLADRR